MVDRHFTEAAEELSHADANGSSLAATLHRFLPVDGAAVSTLGKLLGSETLSASDHVSARLDEVQFDLGEGPCWDALATRQPVMEPNMAQHADLLWPGFRDEIRQLTVGAIFAFPLMIGPLQLGAIDFYTALPSELSELEIAQTRMLTTIVSRIVLRRALRLGNEENLTEPGTEHSRRLVHQATGMAISQLRLSPEDALLLIQGHAFAAGRSLMEIAAEIVDGRLYFTVETNDIEDHQ